MASSRRLVGGRYELVSLVGGGGYGSVWAAVDRRLRPGDQSPEWVAVKLLKDPGEEPQFRFMREQRLHLEHPNLLVPLDQGHDPDRPYLVTRLIRGGSMAGLLADGAVLAPGAVMAIVAQIAEALGVLHEHRIVHRDVKPANILIEPTPPEGGPPHAYLSDFGFALWLDDIRLSATPLTPGTVGYRAPEVCMGAEATPASDLYGLGIVAYEALTGHHVTHASDSATDGDRFADPSELSHEGVPAPLWDLVAQLLDPDPMARPGVDRIRAVAAEFGAQPVTIPAIELPPIPPAPSEPTSGPSRRMLVAVGVGGFVIAALVAGHFAVRPTHAEAGPPTTTAPRGVGPPQQRTLVQPGLNKPEGVALDHSGDVFVVDTANDRVLELTTRGKQVTLGFSGLMNPSAVALDSSGDVFVADYGNNRVLELAKGSSAQRVLGFSDISGPSGVAVDGSGDVFVTESHRTMELPAGHAQVVLPVGVDAPTAVAADAAGDIWVADGNDHRVVELTRAGKTSVLPFVGLEYPVSLAVDSNGDVFVGNESNISQIARLSRTEKQTVLLASNGDGQSALTQPAGLAVDQAGNLYVADSGSDRVTKLSKSGHLTTLMFPGVGSPAGVAVGSSGVVYVADTGSAQVLKLGRDGHLEPLAFTHLVSPTSVAVDPAGDVFVVDGVRVEELTAHGVQKTVRLPDMPGPVGIAIDQAGDLFVAGYAQVRNRVVELPRGGVERTLPFRGLNDPTEVAVDRGGDVFVTDADSGSPKVIELSKGGVQTMLNVAGLSGGLIAGSQFGGLGIAVDRLGDVFVTAVPQGGQYSNPRVLELSRRGVETTLGFEGLSSANDVAVDGDGNVYITATGPGGGVLELTA